MFAETADIKNVSHCGEAAIKVSLKPFQRLVGVLGAKPPRSFLYCIKDGSSDKLKFMSFRSNFSLNLSVQKST